MLELLILSRQASENHSWELASGLRPSCRWRQYLDASSHLDYGCRPCLFFSVGPFVFSCGLGPVLNQWTGRSAGSIFISSCQKVAARRITCCLYRVFLLCVSKWFGLYIHLFLLNSLSLSPSWPGFSPAISSHRIWGGEFVGCIVHTFSRATAEGPD